MKIARFKLIREIYFGEEWFTDNASILTGFLTDDVGSRGEIFIKFINNPMKIRTSSNYSRLIKKNDDVFIECQFDEDPYADCIKMSQENFVSILNQWDQLLKQRPQEIIVYKEGESYRLEGHGFSDKQE